MNRLLAAQADFCHAHHRDCIRATLLQLKPIQPAKWLSLQLQRAFACTKQQDFPCTVQQNPPCTMQQPFPCSYERGAASQSADSERKKKFTLFSDHNGSLLRRQPGGLHTHLIGLRGHVASNVSLGSGILPVLMQLLLLPCLLLRHLLHLLLGNGTPLHR